MWKKIKKEIIVSHTIYERNNSSKYTWSFKLKINNLFGLVNPPISVTLKNAAGSKGMRSREMHSAQIFQKFGKKEKCDQF